MPNLAKKKKNIDHHFLKKQNQLPVNTIGTRKITSIIIDKLNKTLKLDMYQHFILKFQMPLLYDSG